MRHPNVVNEADVEPAKRPSVGGYSAVQRRLGAAAGGRELGCSLIEVEPGFAAFPHHWHSANEEAIIVLAGEGTLRFGTQSIPVRAGDYIAMPIGTEHAHQLVAITRLRYYCISTMKSPEVCGYPDSGKVGAYVGTLAAPVLRKLFRESDARDYFDGEERAGPEPKPR